MQVGDDEVERRVPERALKFLRILGARNVVAHFCECFFDRGQDKGLIVNNEDFCRHGSITLPFSRQQGKQPGMAANP
jgi:hypothetical protein